mgnify:CR=1 FL=1|tara:strand:+ start:587 stop:1918 length:1332 start_codon:yes stop_codon:yes gene_type:complete
MSNVRNLLKQRQQAQIDSLLALEQQQKIDSLKQDSLKKVAADSLMLESLKNIKDIEDMDSQYVQEGPVSGVYSGSDVKERLHEEILDITRDMVLLEANTNVKDDLKRFSMLKQELGNLHSQYQEIYSPILSHAGAASGIRAGVTGTRRSIFNDENLFRFSNANGLDKLWASGIPGSDIHMNLENLTKGRLFASNKEIQNIINGITDLDENNKVYVKTPGFLDIMNEYNLGGESAGWKKIKGTFGFSTNNMNILNWALKAKRIGTNWFLSDEAENENTLSGPGKEFKDRISIYPLEQQKIILETLQNMVDDVYTKGLAIDKQSDILLDEYNGLSKKFIPREEMNTNTMTLYDNDNLVTMKEKQKEIFDLMDTYKYYTAEDFDLNNVLNSISVETLNTEIDKLPDYEKTDAFNELLIKLSDELQEKMQEDPELYSDMKSDSEIWR